MQKIEIHPAYVWTCEECGSDQFERVVSENSGETLEERPLLYVRAPSRVTCKGCGETYETQFAGED